MTHNWNYRILATNTRTTVKTRLNMDLKTHRYAESQPLGLSPDKGSSPIRLQAKESGT